MTRGRRKDMTIPPSRALLQQRDYRARKAQYLADLEERCRRVEGENVTLKREVEELKSRLRQGVGLSGYGPDVAEASAELSSRLVAASQSLVRFQAIAFDKPPQSHSTQMDIDDPPAGYQVQRAVSVASSSHSTTSSHPSQGIINAK
ncbi:hypothetical protein K474DRAFT_1695200 [Panus rudis PR-1116 ss-1]|nr:hypothetical protein K474DRAFT_1695200 [Panus rudis PR-1116 ss-1]